ncbi:MAG: hypothetical protein H0Z28_11445 [Archaeoglobus sp.]|nr:hypothetical protein [Archaeoglobus sp.]
MRRRGEAYTQVSKKNIAALLTILTAVMLVTRLAYVFVNLNAYAYNLAAVFLLFVLSFLWYRRTEGELNKTLLAKHTATSSPIFILLGLMGLSLKNLHPTPYTVIWFASWGVVLLASVFYYVNAKKRRN